MADCVRMKDTLYVARTDFIISIIIIIIKPPSAMSTRKYALPVNKFWLDDVWHRHCSA